MQKANLEHIADLEHNLDVLVARLESATLDQLRCDTSCNFVIAAPGAPDPDPTQPPPPGVEAPDQGGARVVHVEGTADEQIVTIVWVPAGDDESRRVWITGVGIGPSMWPS